VGFAPLQHMRDRRSTQPRASPARYVPPSGFGYPLDGFLPSNPCRFCFTPAALMGYTLRSVHLSESTPPFPAAKTHIPFHRTMFPSQGRAGTPRQPVPGFRPFREFLVPGRVVSAPYTGCSLGVHPSRVHTRTPCSGFRLRSSHVLSGQTTRRTCPHAPQSIYRRSLGFVHRG
jgi:hypothetical protein